MRRKMPSKQNPENHVSETGTLISQCVKSSSSSPCEQRRNGCHQTTAQNRLSSNHCTGKSLIHINDLSDNLSTSLKLFAEGNVIRCPTL